jgi:hypothetical protein
MTGDELPTTPDFSHCAKDKASADPELTTPVVAGLVPEVVKTSDPVVQLV